jgi:hypothetical protein
MLVKEVLREISAKAGKNAAFRGRKPVFRRNAFAKVNIGFGPPAQLS